jgi:hypothetical protein
MVELVSLGPPYNLSALFLVTLPNFSIWETALGLPEQPPSAQARSRHEVRIDAAIRLIGFFFWHPRT